MKKILLVSALLLLTIYANARKFYVSQSGSDANTTTQAQNPATPWATLSKVQSNVTNGDTVLFAKGSKFTGTLTLQSKSNVYFGVYGTGADPLFWGTGSTVGSLVTLRGCTNVTFYGWNISDTTISFSDRYIQAKIQIVFTIESSTTGTVIRRCTMDRIGYGAYITASSRAQTIDSCDIGNLRMIVNDIINPDNDYGGVPVQFSSRNNIFTNNYLHDCWSMSYDYGRDGGGVEFFEEGDTVMNNTIMYNTFYDCNGTFEFGSNSDGVANNPQMNNVIAYNKMINNTTVVYINNNGQYKTKVDNLQFYNNVMVQTVANPNPVGSSGIMFSMATADATVGILVLKNNIIQISNGLPVTPSGQFSGTNLTHTNNVYKLSGGSVTNFTLGITEISTASAIWVSTTGSPQIWDYHLTAGSPAINAGTNVGLTRDFGGSTVNIPPDAGIYELISTLQASSTYTAITCNVGTSIVTVTATGGTPPYTGIGQFVRGAGAYSYTVTDNTGATSPATGTIPEPTFLAASATVGTISCNGGTTMIVVTATGGTPPYTGTGTYTVGAGPYSYTVRDANNCTSSVSGTLSQPTLLNAAVSVGTIQVYGGTTNVTVTAAGGTLPYVYKIDGGNYQSSNIITAVPAGGHVVTTKDANNCTTDNTITVNQPGPLNKKSRLKFINAQ